MLPVTPCDSFKRDTMIPAASKPDMDAEEMILMAHKSLINISLIPEIDLVSISV
jgi:hypothetical protein